MVNETTIKRWAEDAGINVESVCIVDGEPMVPSACGRCSGTGRVWATWVQGGICFACGGQPRRMRKLRSLAQAARSRVAKQARQAVQAQAKRRHLAREARAFLAAHPGLAQVLRRSKRDALLHSFARSLVHWGRLTERQAEVALAKAKREAERPAPVAVPEGRVLVEGVVLTVKDYESTFGYRVRTVRKALVEVDGGAYRVLGTLPSELWDVERGARIRFKATLQPKVLGFGFYKRPTNAELVAGNARRDV